MGVWQFAVVNGPNIFQMLFVYICYYFLNLLRDYKGETTLFYWLFIDMPFTEDKILINNLFDLKG